MTGTELLQETSGCIDIVDLALCLFIHEVCNDCQFEQTIRPRERGKLWAEEFLKRCGISKSYYDKHRGDVCGKGTTKENRNFRESIDKAVESAKRLKLRPMAARQFPI